MQLIALEILTNLLDVYTYIILSSITAGTYIATYNTVAYIGIIMSTEQQLYDFEYMGQKKLAVLR